MRPRFIIRIARLTPDHQADNARFRDCIEQTDGFAMTFEGPRVLVATTGPAPLKCGEHGLILGTMFARGVNRASTGLVGEEVNRIVASRGHHLIHAYWGPYVAVLDDPAGRLEIIRAPWGDLPCYRHDTEAAIYLASDVGLICDLTGYRPRIAWHEVLAQLIAMPIQTSRTCLTGIGALPGGDRLSVDQDGLRQDNLWSPWTFAATACRATDPRQAADMLRETALTCIDARASQFDNIMLTLSGGLDSSIVAACLSRAGHRFSAVTLVTRDAAGDERHFARQVTSALGADLAEAFRDVSRINVDQSGASGRPYPCVKGFLLESNRLIGEAADKTGAQAVFTGGGGDTIFCSLQSGAPAADRLLVEGLGSGFMRSLRDMSSFAGASVPAVMRDAFRRAWSRQQAVRREQNLGLLSQHAQDMARTSPAHPWLPVPEDILPGKAIHAWGLAPYKTYVENLEPRSVRPVIAPLLSQPLVEACLTIPSWMWFEDGLNRVAARHAFAGMLPDPILKRRTKGTPDCFSIQILEAHRPAIRALLAEGEMARQGLIDLPGLLRILDDPSPVRDARYERILDILDMEVWARSWGGSGG